MQKIIDYLERSGITFEESEAEANLPCLNFKYRGLGYQVIYTENFVEGHLTVRVNSYMDIPFIGKQVEVSSSIGCEVSSSVKEVNLDIEYNFSVDEDPTIELDIVLNNDDKDNLDFIFSLQSSKYNKLCAAIFQSI